VISRVQCQMCGPWTWIHFSAYWAVPMRASCRPSGPLAHSFADLTAMVAQTTGPSQW